MNNNHIIYKFDQNLRFYDEQKSCGGEHIHARSITFRFYTDQNIENNTKNPTLEFILPSHSKAIDAELKKLKIYPENTIGITFRLLINLNQLNKRNEPKDKFKGALTILTGLLVTGLALSIVFLPTLPIYIASLGIGVWG